MTKLTLGTGQITQQRDGSFLLRYMNIGSFLVGERDYSRREDAVEFCQERGIKVLG